MSDQRGFLLALTTIAATIWFGAVVGIAEAGPLEDANAAYKRGDGPAAVELLLPLAEGGDANAEFFLGSIYDNGREGIQRDSVEAVKWFRRAADQGHADAQASLGVMYALGRGVPQDDIEAANWLLRSFYQGNMEAQGPLADIYTREMDSFTTAAEQGDPEAQFHLAVIAESGLSDAQSPAEAVNWYRKAAEQGHVWAQSSLGTLYSIGRGVEQDDVESLKWFRRAAEQGFAVAQASVGEAYYLGIGIPVDYAEAEKWWLRAADQGYAKAQYYLALAHTSGEALPHDDVLALMWLSIAAQRWTPFEAEARMEADRLHESLAEKMTLAQIAEARRLAGDWKPGERPQPRLDGVKSEVADRLFEKGLEALQRDRTSTGMVPSDEISAASDAWEPLAEQGYRIDVSQLGQIDAEVQTSMVIIGLVAYDMALVSNDYALPLMLWQPLAELGNAEAQFNLGLLYSQGLGVPRDVVLAHMLFDLSAAELGASAATKRDDLAAYMTPDELSEARRLARHWRPAANGLAQSYKLTIVSHEGEASGVFVVSSEKGDVRNYYIVVEALDEGGEAILLPIVNEETGRTEKVSIWGVRVPQSTYEAVRADKLDDGVIQNNILGEKRSGSPDVRYFMDVENGTITHW